MRNILFKGIMPTLVTPLERDATVRVRAVSPLVKWQLSMGVDGFYVLGGTGEGAVLGERERMRMAEAAVDAARESGKPVIVHVGAADTQEAVRLARHAAKIGASAISSVYPSFFFAYDLSEAAAYYQALTEASGLPMLCYLTAMIPGLNAVSLVERMMKIDGVIGCKYTLLDCFQLQRIKDLNGGDINVINGPDETLICALAMGADGGIGTSYNLMPDRFVALYDRFRQGDLAGAMQAQREINRVITVILRHGIIPVTKCALEAMGFEVGFGAFPARTFEGEARAQIMRELEGAGLVLRR